MPAKTLPTEFENREALAAFLQEEFGDVLAGNDALSPHKGGLEAATERLNAIKPARYAKTRNYLDGDVTLLSPYIRHGVLSLSQVRAKAIEMIGQRYQLEKFIQELAWRDYYQRVYQQKGNDIWQDIEEYKTGYDASEYADDLPEDIERGETGVAAIDGFAQILFDTGYLHNHARMYLAAYVVHWRQVKWQAGARWFLTHLVDGDPASNNLSWQWVASTFSHKPYIFNLGNVQKYAGDIVDTSFHNNKPIAGTYAEISDRLFPQLETSHG